MKEINYCPACKKYTLNDICGCTLKTTPVAPARYSPEDKYGKYRRKAKEEERKKQGLL
ncbi:MAG: nucleolar RNA-binding Nop10p family protein [Candidatus Woesearchaeota archaeon]